MADEQETDDRPDPAEDHAFSEGQGFDDPYEGFDLDPPELTVDAGKVDPVDSRVIADELDRRQTVADDVDADELIDVGLSYMGIQRFEQAVDTFERAARFTEDDATRQEAWVNKGAAHAELEEWQAAIDSYREALYVDSEGEHAAAAETNLAYALWESGATEQALEHAEAAVEIDPRHPQAWYNRGFFLLERGLAEDAVNAFENAQRLGFRSPELLEELARGYEELGQDERAEELANEAEEVRQKREEELIE
jgi:tetratricopeptide (TPR) repeat protein